MMLFVPPIEFRPPLPRTKISKALTTYETSQVGGVDGLYNRPLAVEGTHYTIDPDCTHHVRNMAKTQITSFRLDRTNVSGNLFFRFKFTGASADYNFFSFNRASDRVRLWFASKVAINIWHEIKVEYGATCKYYLNNVLKYSGPDIGLPCFILNNTASEAWFDTGSGDEGTSTYGASLPAGYTWY